MAAGEVENPAVARGVAVPKNHTDRKRALGRGALHGYGLSAGVLFALSWLLEVLSALGDGAVPKFEKHQQQGGRGRDVTLGAGATAIVESSVDRNMNDPRPVLIVTGLVQEARIAAGPGMIVICSSSDPKQLRALLATLSDSATFRGVISFGVAGGLDPSLKSGDVVVATEVLAGDTRFLAGSGAERGTDRPCCVASPARSPRWPRRVEQVIAATACKAALHSETGAAAVDMESHIAAAYAAKAGLPFAALRVISDPASRALPALAKSAIKPNGDIDLGKVLRGVARNPTIAARAGFHGARFQSRAALPTRLPRLPARRRGARHRGDLNFRDGTSGFQKRSNQRDKARSEPEPRWRLARTRARAELPDQRMSARGLQRTSDRERSRAQGRCSRAH